jgi:hypothetical protein
MNLSGFFSRKNTTPDSYFGLFLRGDSAVGFIFQITDRQVELVAKEICEFSNGWEGVVDDIDELLAVLENETKIHVDKTIFFVYSYFIDQDTQEIREPYKGIMKKIAKELDLKPLGFIEAHESVKDMIEKRDASPLNGIIIEIDQHHLSIYIYKGGKMIHTDNTSRTDSTTDDLRELFNRKKEQYLLPSKIIVYGTSHIEKEARVIKEHPWDDDIFIQTPRVQMLKGEELLTGLSNTFMSQLEKDLAPEALEDDAPDEELAAAMAPELEEEKPSRKKTSKPEVQDDGEPDEAARMGFVIGEDVTEHTEIKPPKQSGAKSGFALPSFAAMLPKFIFPKGTASTVPRGASNGAIKRNIIIGVIAILILAGAGTAEYFLHKATIDITLPTDTISEDLSLSASSGGGDGGFTIDKKTVNVTIEEKLATSGKREVGKKAKGTVILNNFEDRPLTFKAGTKITSGSLSYTLDSDVTIASASARGNTIEAQVKEVEVTAAEIGEEYNIAAEKVLSVDGAPSRTNAVTKGAFSGGTKKTLKTISARDIELLNEALEKASKEKANEVVKKGEAGKTIVLTDLTKVVLSGQKYSGEVGEEANEVSVTATAKIEYYAYNEEDLAAAVASELEKSVPSGFTVDKGSLSYKIREADAKSNRVELAVSSDATIVKKVNKEEILSRIAGKNLDTARDILRREFEAETVEIRSNSSPILILNGMLPFLPKNIELNFKTV